MSFFRYLATSVFVVSSALPLFAWQSSPPGGETVDFRGTLEQGGSHESGLHVSLQSLDAQIEWKSGHRPESVELLKAYLKTGATQHRQTALTVLAMAARR